jgi:hypothetical protein
MLNIKKVMERYPKLVAFGLKYGLKFISEGTVGFGYPCVGFAYDRHFVAYNPYVANTGYIQEYYDKRHNEIAAKNRYHKGDYLCVLVGNDDIDDEEEELKEEDLAS